MKVLTVVEDMGIGGTQRVALNLSLGLSALGARTAVLAYGGRGPREAAFRAGGLPVFAPSTDDTSESVAIEAAKRWAPNIIHIHRTGYTKAEETRILRYLRSDGAKTVETNVFARFDWSEGGRLIDAHCLLSRWCSFKWNAWGGQAAREKRSFILPNAVDAASIKPLSESHRRRVRERLGIPPDRFIFGRVGQPMIDKWTPALFDVFTETLQRHDIGLLLVGVPPEMQHRFNKMPDYAKARVIICPTTASDKRLSSLIGAMDGFLHMSTIGESFGMVLCEAMLGGVPVVTLSTPLRDNSQLEVVGHEKGGLVALSLDAVPTAMSRLIEDARLRKAVREHGNEWVTSRFGIDVISNKAAKIYEAVLSGVSVARCASMNDSDKPPDEAWLKATLSTGIGRGPDLRTELLLKVLHHPLLYRAYLSAKQLIVKDEHCVAPTR